MAVFARQLPVTPSGGMYKRGIGQASLPFAMMSVSLTVRLVGIGRMQPTYRLRRDPGTHGVPFWGVLTTTEQLDPASVVLAACCPRHDHRRRTRCRVPCRTVRDDLSTATSPPHTDSGPAEARRVGPDAPCGRRTFGYRLSLSGATWLIAALMYVPICCQSRWRFRASALNPSFSSGSTRMPSKSISRAIPSRNGDLRIADSICRWRFSPAGSLDVAYLSVYRSHPAYEDGQAPVVGNSPLADTRQGEGHWTTRGYIWS